MQDPFDFHLVGSTWQCRLCKTCLVSVCVNAIHVIQAHDAEEEAAPEKRRQEKLNRCLDLPGVSSCVLMCSYVFYYVFMHFHCIDQLHLAIWNCVVGKVAHGFSAF